MAPAAHHPAHRRLRVVHAPPDGRPGWRRRRWRPRHLQRRQGLGASLLGCRYCAAAAAEFARSTVRCAAPRSLLCVIAHSTLRLLPPSCPLPAPHRPVRPAGDPAGQERQEQGQLQGCGGMRRGQGGRWAVGGGRWAVGGGRWEGALCVAALPTLPCRCRSLALAFLALSPLLPSPTSPQPPPSHTHRPRSWSLSTS